MGFVEPLMSRTRRAGVAALRSRLVTDRRGSVAIYSAFVGALLVGGGVLAVDVGRMVVARGEMQDACDSMALSAAKFLDGSVGAIARATEVVSSRIQHASGVLGSVALDAAAPIFYNDFTLGSTQTVTVLDDDARFVRVTMNAETMSIFLSGILDLVSSGGGVSSSTFDATCVAEYSPNACEITPLMVCDPADPNAADSVLNVSNTGRQIISKRGPGDPLANASGNFGLLVPSGGPGASSVADAMANPGNASCQGDSVTTEPGGATNMIVNAIRSRFGINPPGPIEPNPALNVMGYMQDRALEVVGSMGNGEWDPVGYWENPALPDPSHDPLLSDHIPLGHGTFADQDGAFQALNAFAALDPLGLRYPTRYQTYLYEIGETFKYCSSAPGWTIYPWDLPNPPGCTGTWTTVNPSHASAASVAAADPLGEPALIPQSGGNPAPPEGTGSGLPDDATDFTPACDDFTDEQCQVLQRTMLVVVVDCLAEGISGKTTVDGIANYVRLFITEPSQKPPGAADIKAEIIGPEFAGSSGVIDVNVRLVE